MNFSIFSLVSLDHSAHYDMKSFDLSIDQRFIVFGGVKPFHRFKRSKEESVSQCPKKFLNIVTIEPFSFAQKGFEQKTDDKELDSFVQSFEDFGSLSLIQIMQVKSDKKKKLYFVLYSTQNMPGFNILTLAIDKTKIFLRKLEFNGLDNISPEDHKVNFTISQNYLAVHCDSKISLVVFKIKK